MRPNGRASSACRCRGGALGMGCCQSSIVECLEEGCVGRGETVGCGCWGVRWGGVGECCIDDAYRFLDLWEVSRGCSNCSPDIPRLLIDCRTRVDGSWGVRRGVRQAFIPCGRRLLVTRGHCGGGERASVRACDSLALLYLSFALDLISGKKIPSGHLFFPEILPEICLNFPHLVLR